MRCQFLIAVAALGFVVSAAFSRPALLITHSGQRLEGDCTERGEDVIIRIHGVATTIPREQIASLEYQKDFADEFADRLAKLGATDTAGRIELARWAIQQRQYTAARDVIDRALVADPNNAEAAELARLVQGQLRLAARARARQMPPKESVESDPPEAVPLSRTRLLNLDDVQAVRRAEWQGEDDSMRVRVDPKLARIYAESRQIRAEDFLRRRPIEQADAILEDKYATDAERRAVSIYSDPPAIVEFRRVVQPLILNGCATAGCHGGVNAVKFALVSPVGSDEAAYTNFVTLTKYTQHVLSAGPRDGVFAGDTDLKMIERGHSRRSLLVQYALPPEVAEFDHPKVRNLTPLFRSVNDQKATQIIDWIDHSLRQRPGDYGVTPGARAAVTAALATQPESP